MSVALAAPANFTLAPMQRVHSLAILCSESYLPGMHWSGCLMHWLVPVETQRVGVNGTIEFGDYWIVAGRRLNPFVNLDMGSE